MKLYQAIAQNARLLAKKESIHHEAARNRQKRIEDSLPYGFGFDRGTRIESVTDQKIVFSTALHHMNQNGFYDGWTEHQVVVSASLCHGIDVVVRGRETPQRHRPRGKDRNDINDIKDFIAEVFSGVLLEEFEWLERKPSSRSIGKGETS